MSIERQQAIEYLRTPAGGLWRWSENGAVIVWRDGTTIAFLEEIRQIIATLSSQGLPLFGPVVLLLAACRGKYPSMEDIIDVRHAALDFKGALAADFAQIQKLAGFPSNLITGIRAKCLLVEAIFEGQSNRSIAKVAANITVGVQFPLSDADLNGESHQDPRRITYAHVHILAEGLKHHTPESLTLRLKTGLDALPVPVEKEIPVAERARQLIKELNKDRELGLVARAARELMAAVRLPRRLGEREQLAIGGVSDITNRGSLDRLLLSEMAHDDLTLAVRVALNEALYLRREPPAHEPPGALALLLDSGLRLWGVPRVLAVSVALALIAQDKRGSQLFTWRADGKKLAPLDLLSSDGLTRHLGTLETTVHPGESLAAFTEAIAHHAEGQSVLITHPDTLADADFIRALSAVSNGPGYIATVDNDGHFALHALPLSHRAPICRADLDLTKLFGEAPNLPLIKKHVDADLPAIFGVTPFPFLLPLHGRANDWVIGDNGFTYAELNDRRLVSFSSTSVGGRVLSADVPAGKTIWLDEINGTVHLVKSSTTHYPARLVSFPLPDGPMRVAELTSGPEPLAVHNYGNVILIIRAHDIRAYSLDDGASLGTIRNPYQWVHGRFLRGDHYFYFVVWDGERIKFEPVSLPSRFVHDQTMLVFDRAGVPGPWLIDKRGAIASSASDEEQRFQLPPGAPGLGTAMASRDGHRVYASIRLPCWAVLKKLVSGETYNLSVNQHVQLLLNPPPALPNRNLYRYLTSIAVAADGLVLFGRKSRSRKIIREEGFIRLSDFVVGNLLHGPVEFSATPQTTSYGCSLQLAQWPNGSRAWFDDRGLLHLRSIDPSVPEVSLVLCHGEIAGWTSYGQVCGPAFFFEGNVTAEPDRVFDAVLQFIKHL